MDTLRNILDSKGRAVHTIDPDATVHAAVEEMCRRRVGALLVTRDGAPVGIVSERDVMARLVLARRHPAEVRVRDIMTTDVVCVAPDEETSNAMGIMTQRRCRHLPVVEHGRVIGMVSIGDLVRWASRTREIEIRMLQEFVSGSYPG